MHIFKVKLLPQYATNSNEIWHTASMGAYLQYLGSCFLNFCFFFLHRVTGVKYSLILFFFLFFLWTYFLHRVTGVKYSLIFFFLFLFFFFLFLWTYFFFLFHSPQFSSDLHEIWHVDTTGPCAGINEALFLKFDLVSKWRPVRHLENL